MYAIILAAGLGTRLRPYTFDKPKPMVLLDGKPILEHQINYLKMAGINDIVIVENYKHEVIQDYFGNGAKFGTNIYHYKNSDTNVAHLITDTLQQLPGEEKNALIMMGDVLSTTDLRKLVQQHNNEGNLATLCAAEYSFPEGIIQFDQNSPHTSIVRNKPRLLIFAGIAMVNRELIPYLQQESGFSSVVNRIEGRSGVYQDSQAKWWHISETRDDVARVSQEMREIEMQKEAEGMMRRMERL